jgi:hypothetical protein
MSSLTVCEHLPEAAPDSLDSVLVAERASVPSNHTHVFPTETCVRDRHAEERVFVLLVVGCKGVLVKQREVQPSNTNPPLAQAASG